MTPSAVSRHVIRHVGDLQHGQVARFTINVQHGVLNFTVTVNERGMLRYSMDHVMDGRHCVKDALFVAFRDDAWWLYLVLCVHGIDGKLPSISIRGRSSSGSLPPIAA